MPRIFQVQKNDTIIQNKLFGFYVLGIIDALKNSVSNIFKLNLCLSIIIMFLFLSFDAYGQYLKPNANENYIFQKILNDSNKKVGSNCVFETMNRDEAINNSIKIFFKSRQFKEYKSRFPKTTRFSVPLFASSVHTGNKCYVEITLYESDDEKIHLLTIVYVYPDGKIKFSSMTGDDDDDDN